MHQDDIIFGMIDRVEDLVRREAHIDRMQDGTDHWYSKKTFQITMAVPVHNRHGVARFNAKSGERVRKTTDPFAKGAVVKTQVIAVDNLLFGIINHRISEKVFNQQRVGICRGGSFNQKIIHSYSPDKMLKKRPVAGRPLYSSCKTRKGQD